MSAFLKKYLSQKDALSFGIAVLLHGALLIFLFLSQKTPDSSGTAIVQNFVAADVLPEKESEPLKESSEQQPVQQAAKVQTAKKDVVLTPSKNIPNNNQTGGGSTTGFKNGDAGEAIASKGSGGEGYGTGSGSGVAYQNQDVYRVAVEEMPEPYGGVEAIRSKVKSQIANSGISSAVSVYVLAFIDESGIVRKVQITKGVGRGIDEIIASAVQRTRFRPGKDKGRVVKVQMHIGIPVTQ
jgi:hypothetical protein